MQRVFMAVALANGRRPRGLRSRGSRLVQRWSLPNSRHQWLVVSGSAERIEGSDAVAHVFRRLQRSAP